MYRTALEYLGEWTKRISRKPLIIRGTRQVGKSYLVRMLAESLFDNLLEINLETDTSVSELFASKNPTKIVNLLEAKYGRTIVPGKTLLFLDEVQTAPELFASLRYFFEKMPDLHVITAGSLLDFMLDEHDFSMPVGRIEYLHLGPMTFDEFLIAARRKNLLDMVRNFNFSAEIPLPIHQELISLFRQYSLVGGMPAAVEAFLDSKSFLETAAVQQSILSTYRDDFTKYGKKVDRRRIDKVFNKVPMLVGSKFMYTRIDKEERARDLGRAFDLLCLARVIHRVSHSSANGIPLGAEASDKIFKVLFMDVGLMCRALGLHLADIEAVDDLMLVNQGALCEQFIGQHLLYSGEPFEEPSLHCWIRQKSQSNAEVDYLIALGDKIIPVEVKAGKTGTLKSLHVFLDRKKRNFAVRFNSDLPSLLAAETSVVGQEKRPFHLMSLPLYMVSQTKRLCREHGNKV
jgi:predicted AAA+ superfamily ATPase